MSSWDNWPDDYVVEDPDQECCDICGEPLRDEPIAEVVIPDNRPGPPHEACPEHLIIHQSCFVLNVHEVA